MLRKFETTFTLDRLPIGLEGPLFLELAEGVDTLRDEIESECPKCDDCLIVSSTLLVNNSPEIDFVCESAVDIGDCVLGEVNVMRSVAKGLEQLNDRMHGM